MANYTQVFNRNSWIKYQRSVSATITSLNPEVDKVFYDLWNAGFRQIYLKPNRAKSTDKYAIDKNTLQKIQTGYQKLFAFFAAELATGRTEHLQAICSRFDYAGRFFCRILLNTPVTKRCGAAQGTFSLRNNGDVYPCDTYAAEQKHKLGNIYTGYKPDSNFVPLAGSIENCRTCVYRYICGGPCKVWAEYNAGNIAIECTLNKFLINECFQLITLLEEYPDIKLRLQHYIQHSLGLFAKLNPPGKPPPKGKKND